MYKALNVLNIVITLEFREVVEDLNPEKNLSLNQNLVIEPSSRIHVLILKGG
jgi:hypothetical protein